METGVSLRNRQGGVVAVMVGLSMALLIGFLALVIDLGHLYIAKTGLQNAADAAALSGAKQLDGTATGICAASGGACDANSAVSKAIEAAGRNTFFGNSAESVVVIDTSNISFSSSQNGPWENVAEAMANPGSKYFIKVDTQSGDLNVWFASIWNILITNTYGSAVAGPLKLNVTPIAVCAVDTTAQEEGFWRGVTYNVPKLNPLAISADPIWINPLDSYPGPCNPNNGNTPILAPFVCTGQIASIASVPGRVWVNTGGQTTLNAPMNSRFGVPTAYTGGHACEPSTAPADTNVKEYVCTRQSGGGANPDSCDNNPPNGSPRDWMDAAASSKTPIQQSITMDSSARLPLNYPARLNSLDQWGALWSYAKERNHATGSAYTLSDWASLYGGNADTGPNGYPSTGTPYEQSSGKYFQAPTGQGATFATARRRVLNMVIIDCKDPAISSMSGATCNVSLPVVAVGQFFMQRQSDLPNNLFVEFAGLASPSMLKPQYVLFK